MEKIDQTRNINTLLILHDLQQSVPGFQFTRFGRMNLPASYKEAVEYVEDIRHFYNVSDGLRYTFGGMWKTTSLFDMPQKFYDRTPVSIAYAQLEICKNNLRDLLATIYLYSNNYRELAEHEVILQNILFSLDSVKIDDPSKIKMLSMTAPLL